MMFSLLTENQRLTRLATYSLVALCALTGCTSDPYEYKTQADEKVYGIIEQKWSDDLPSPANYRISDVTPGPDDIQIERIVPPDGVLTLPQAAAIATACGKVRTPSEGTTRSIWISSGPAGVSLIR